MKHYLLTTYVFVILTTLFIFVPFLSISKADVACGDDKGFRMIIVHGSISENDFNDFIYCNQNLAIDDPGFIQVWLDSPGGDVYTAMKIGRFMREKRLLAKVGSDASCNSSCVFLLVGAVNRMVFGSVGIHRPYSTSTGYFEYNEIQKKYSDVKVDIENYLKEMNMPKSLFDAMERIPPQEVKVLNEEELGFYGLSKMDPVEQEVRDLKSAKIYGLSRQEFYKRQKLVTEQCQSYVTQGSKKYFDCHGPIMWGLPLDLYLERDAKKSEMCGELSKEEYHECRRKVMHNIITSD